MKILHMILMSMITVSCCGCSTTPKINLDSVIDPTNNSKKEVQKYTVINKRTEQRLPWIKKPGSIDIDDFKNIAYVINSEGYSSYSNHYSYGPSWMKVNATDMVGAQSYSNDAIIGYKDGAAKIYRFNGTTSSTSSFHTFEPDFITGTYDYDSDTNDENNVKHFDKDFNMRTTYVNGIGGEISPNYTLYCNGSVYYYDGTGISSTPVTPDYNQTQEAYIIPSVDAMTMDNEQDVVGMLEVGEMMPQPDGFVLISSNGEVTKLPDGMAPVYYTEIVKADMYANKSEQYNTAFVNGYIKLYDQNNKIHIWNAISKAFVKDEAFDDATYYEDGYIGVNKHGKWAFMDDDGKLVTDYVFDKVSALYDGKAYAKYKGKIGIIQVNA